MQVDIGKDAIGDRGDNSKRGCMILELDENDSYITKTEGTGNPSKVFTPHIDSVDTFHKHSVIDMTVCTTASCLLAFIAHSTRADPVYIWPCIGTLQILQIKCMFLKLLSVLVEQNLWWCLQVPLLVISDCAHVLCLS